MRHIMRFLVWKPLLRPRPVAAGPTRQFLGIAKKSPALMVGAAISLTLLAYTPSAHGFAQKAVDQLIERRECLRCDLRGADLSHKRLRGVNLSGAYFIGANLGKVILRDSMMARAKLAEARLRKADISGARMQGAELLGARDITQDQLLAVCGDAGTLLPLKDFRCGAAGDVRDEKDTSHVYHDQAVPSYFSQHQG